MRREPSRARQKPGVPPQPTVRLLLQDIAEGIRVLQTRDGVLLSNEQILERARNIVTGLLGNYRIRSLEAREFRGRLPISQMDLLDQLESARKRATTAVPAAPDARVSPSARWVVVGACALISRPRRKPATRAIRSSKRAHRSNS